MNFYLPAPLDEAELCQPVADADFETIITQINGTPRAPTWRPIRMMLVPEDEGRHLSASDSPWLGEHALIFRPRAAAALEPLLSQWGELLPLDCEGSELVIYNPTRVLDALDEEASSVIRFDSGRITTIERHVFRPEAVRGVPIFKLPDPRNSPTFVDESAVRKWRAAGLRGLRFTRVWTSSQ